LKAVFFILLSASVVAERLGFDGRRGQSRGAARCYSSLHHWYTPDRGFG